MELIRKATLTEERLIELLVRRASINVLESWKDTLLVCPMEDGGMGSLLLFPKGEISSNRTFGKQISEFQFTDLDGVKVIASLNVDTNGELFELDIWKTDFNKLLKLPDL